MDAIAEMTAAAGAAGGEEGAAGAGPAFDVVASDLLALRRGEGRGEWLLDVLECVEGGRCHAFCSSASMALAVLAAAWDAGPPPPPPQWSTAGGDVRSDGGGGHLDNSTSSPGAHRREEHRQGLTRRPMFSSSASRLTCDRCGCVS
jgi:hypothetical protein